MALGPQSTWLQPPLCGIFLDNKVLWLPKSAQHTLLAGGKNKPTTACPKLIRHGLQDENNPNCIWKITSSAAPISCGTSLSARGCFEAERAGGGNFENFFWTAGNAGPGTSSPSYCPWWSWLLPLPQPHKASIVPLLPWLKAVMRGSSLLSLLYLVPLLDASFISPPDVVEVQ